MKKKRVLLTLLVIAALLAIVTVVFMHESPKDEQEKTETTKQEEVVPLVINTQKEHLGKVTIRLDGKIVYEYKGPIDVSRRNGEYLIEVQSSSCSCFDNEVSE